MKVQEVILRAIAGSLKWGEAAEIIGVSDRTMRRWRQRYEKHGYDGLYDYRRRQPSPKKPARQILKSETGANSAERPLPVFQQAARRWFSSVRELPPRASDRPASRQLVFRD